MLKNEWMGLMNVIKVWWMYLMLKNEWIGLMNVFNAKEWMHRFGECI